MTRYYRGALTAALIACLTLPAFAQTPAPTPMTPPVATAPAAPGAEMTPPADKSAAPNSDEAKTGAAVKHHARHHRHHRHHVATAKSVMPVPDASKPPAQK